MRASRRQRRGAILLEVIVGMTVLAIAGIGWMALLAQTRWTIGSVRARESQTSDASDLLERMRHYREVEYAELLGMRRTGLLTQRVTPVAPHLYALEILDSAAQAVVLQTMVYAHDTATVVR